MLGQAVTFGAVLALVSMAITYALNPRYRLAVKELGVGHLAWSFVIRFAILAGLGLLVMWMKSR